jgi:RHH-type proline utilization regulon transcriptional repressor/proline dehydrogenase/delta 1-pyrroline-5-carboxylate dehydrogenase
VPQPVGTPETLLAHARRLLENGANTSFVNHIGDADAGSRTGGGPVASTADQTGSDNRRATRNYVPRQLFADLGLRSA